MFKIDWIVSIMKVAGGLGVAGLAVCLFGLVLLGVDAQTNGGRLGSTIRKKVPILKPVVTWFSREESTRSSNAAEQFLRSAGLRLPQAERVGVARLSDDAEVIGVSIAGQHRAYAVGALARPGARIVNDVLGSTPVTIAFCTQDHKGRVVTLAGRSEPLDVVFWGFLRNKSMLEIDRRVYAYDARDLPCLDVPFSQTTWGVWKTDHPDSSVVADRPLIQETKMRIAGVRQPPISSAAAADLADETAVIGVRVNGRARAYLPGGMCALATHVVNDLVGGTPVTVTYCNTTDCVRVLTQMGKTEPLEVAVSGFGSGQMTLELAGQAYRQDAGELPLKPLDFVRTTWGDWKASNPGSDVYLGTYAEGGD